jgi:hypothetical protein
MGDGLYTACGIAAFPNDGIRDAARLGSRALVDAIQHFEQIAVLFFLSDFQQVDLGVHVIKPWGG